VPNRGEDRLLAKPSKRDLAWSEDHLRGREEWTMNTHAGASLPADELLTTHRHLRVDTERLTPAEAADTIVQWHSGRH
jgi:hypothetical protein